MQADGEGVVIHGYGTSKEKTEETEGGSYAALYSNGVLLNLAHYSHTTD